MRLKATFPNKDNQLWPGDFVNARVLVQTRLNVLTIPSAAVQRGPNGVFAYVVKADSTVEMRPLKLGEEAGSITIVEKGLQDGERVTTSNQYRLQPNIRVQTQPVAEPLKTLRGVRLHEYFRPLHRKANSDLAGDGGDLHDRAGRLSIALGCAAAASRFSDHSGEYNLAGRQFGHDGIYCRNAAGKPVFTNSRRRAIDFDKRDGQHPNHDPVRS